ncbi:MAG: ATP-NAD kinase family protein [Bacillota bacterium]|nr:ATP-NAD kinase family protein [Bacillota bacterium]NLV69714.1 ATP-NAD kinase family protein [Clostridiales bacterium]HPF18217.1 ATP-NAD kinase family protein [Bacillota bacterium]
MTKIGLIVNPIAGLGGSVGLKGTDGMVEEALRRGAEPLSNARAAAALRELLPLRETLLICTGADQLGGSCAESLGFKTRILHEASERSGAADTRALAKKLTEEGVRILLFAGGDGTAADIYEAIGEKQTVLGIPAGVKIYSPVYAATPKAAGELAGLYLTGARTAVREAEVLDIDEALYRQGRVDVRLRGYLTAPEEKRFMQGRKAPSPLSEAAAAHAIAGMIIRDMEPDTCYLIGAGTTTRRIMERLELPYTLIGVDLICNKKLVEADVYGSRILELSEGWPLKLILTVTGGQGFLLGRGNQQLTPDVLKTIGKENIIVAATQKKLASLGGQTLRLDTGVEELDRQLAGYYRVVAGYDRFVVVRAE